MIRKFATVEGPVDLVRDMFVDAGSWVEWMPGVKSVDIIKESAGYAQIGLIQNYQGRKFDQLIDVWYDSKGMRQKQLSGWFKKWEVNWRFLSPPSGSGTTVSCDLDLEMGGMTGLLVSHRMVQELIDGLFDEIITNARQRTRKLASESRPPTGAGPESVTLLQVFQTDAGLEVWVSGKKYQFKSGK